MDHISTGELLSTHVLSSQSPILIGMSFIFLCIFLFGCSIMQKEFNDDIVGYTTLDHWYVEGLAYRLS